MSRLSDHLDGTLSPRLARRVRRHLDTCANCFHVYVSLARIVADLRALGSGDRPQPRPSVAETVLERLSANWDSQVEVQPSATSGASENGV